MLIALNKPYRVMSQFSASVDKRTLADFVDIAAVYPAGRLDHDSEGLLLLTDDGALQHALSAPSAKLAKRYWVQVEGLVATSQLQLLASGILLDGRNTLPGKASRLVDEPPLWPRLPPIRERQNIPTSWIELEISEGRNRQIRRMTAAVGLPTLRLVRVGIGALDLLQLGLAPGAWVKVELPQISAQLLQKHTLPANPPATRSASPRR